MRRRIFDGVNAEYIDESVVTIDGNRIAELGRVRPASAAGETVDVRGSTLMPGLIDAHCHVLGSSTNYKAVIFLAVVGWLIPVLFELAAHTSVLASIVYLNNMTVVFWLVPYALICIAAIVFLWRSGRALGAPALAAAVGLAALVGVMATEALSSADPTSANMERLSLLLIVIGSLAFIVGGRANRLMTPPSAMSAARTCGEMARPDSPSISTDDSTQIGSSR